MFETHHNKIKAGLTHLHAVKTDTKSNQHRFVTIGSVKFQFSTLMHVAVIQTFTKWIAHTSILYNYVSQIHLC